MLDVNKRTGPLFVLKRNEKVRVIAKSYNLNGLEQKVRELLDTGSFAKWLFKKTGWITLQS